jgi:homoserine O-acetyltransferase
MVRAQAMLLDHLGIAQLHAVVGGSMGGMQTLSLGRDLPDRIEGGARDRIDGAAFGAEYRVPRGRAPGDHGRSQLADGDYYADACTPAAGLAVARMAAHITYLSESGLTEKFGRRLQAREAKSRSASMPISRSNPICGIRAELHRPLRRQRLSLYHARDGLFRPGRGIWRPLANAPFARSRTRFALVSFDTDWLYPTAESRAVVHALNASGAAASFVELSAPFGHDSFLLDVPALDRVVSGFICADS